MNIGKRLEAIGKLIPPGVSIADIGTDHAYLPTWLAERNLITKAVAGDIAAGPCLAARTTVAMYGLAHKIEVRMGSGLSIIKSGEVDVIIIAGMGAGTMIDILEADMEIAKMACRLILQPMAGAPTLRRWAHANGWFLSEEVLVEEGRHLYEIIVLELGAEDKVSDVAYEVGPRLLDKQVPLLSKQIAKLKSSYHKLLQNMAGSETARQSAKYKEIKKLLMDLEAIDYGRNGK